MSAVACPSIPPVVAEEVLATAHLKTVMAQAETTTTVTAMATIIPREVRLRHWHLRDTIHIHTLMATLVGERFLAPIPASTHLSTLLTLVRSVCHRVMVVRCTVSHPI